MATTMPVRSPRIDASLPTIEGEGIVSDMPIVQSALKGDRPVNDELFATVLDNVTDMYMDAESDADLQSMFGEPTREALQAVR